MATKKTTKKKQLKSKRTSGRKVAPMKNAVEKKVAKKRVTLKKKLAKKKSAPKKVVAQTKVGGKKTTSGKTAGALKKQAQGKSQSVDTLEGLGVQAGGQSGDLQGLSNVQGADSESVDELLEQGNTFEADVVKGVEDAGNADEGEVRSHEGRQDDVPGKYPDKK
jgi:hypothetical protein